MIRKRWREITADVATCALLSVNNLMSAIDDPIEELVAIFAYEVNFITRVCECTDANFRNRLLVVVVVVIIILTPRISSYMLRDKFFNRETSLIHLIH